MHRYLIIAAVPSFWRLQGVDGNRSDSSGEDCERDTSKATLGELLVLNNGDGRDRNAIIRQLVVLHFH